MGIKPDDKKQFLTVGIFLVIYALLVLITYIFIPLEQLASGQEMPAPMTSMPRWLFGIAAAIFVVILYGLLGLAGYWFSIRLTWQRIYRVDAGWRQWAAMPAIWGLAIGVLMVVADQVISRVGGVKSIPHPAFPFSIIASASAGIGEEILFRFFVMGLWAYILTRFMKSPQGTKTAFWVANIIAALGFSASHMPTAMFLFGVSTPADLPIPTIIELVILNSLVGLVAGDRYIKYGLVAAIGIHFWADILWHVLWPLVA